MSFLLFCLQLAWTTLWLFVLSTTSNQLPCNADADKELKFSVNEEGRYVAEAIPRQVGIHAGAIVEGVVRHGNDSSNVEPLVSKDRRTDRVVNLGELAKAHKIDLDLDTLVMEKKARYCTHLCKVDTKEYGLPLTRERKVRNICYVGELAAL